ncbi:MAG: hypothetical protein ACRDCG_02285 [Mycoplasmoidaceae bacterium]
MINILCWNLGIKVTVTSDNFDESFLKNKNILSTSSLINLSGEGLISSKILKKIGIHNIFISNINNDYKDLITKKLCDENIDFIGIDVFSDFPINIEILSNNSNYLISSAKKSNGIENNLVDVVKKLNKSDILLIFSPCNYKVIYRILEICANNSISFYLDFKDHYNLEIIKFRPFLVTFSFKQVSNITKIEASELNIFNLIDLISELNLENIIVINKNKIFAKIKNQNFSLLCEEFTKVNKIIDREMLISVFIAILPNYKNLKNAMLKAVDIIWKYTFNFENYINLDKEIKKVDKFLGLSTENRKEKYSFDLKTYWETKEIVFIISENYILNNDLKKKIENCIINYFKSNTIRIKRFDNKIYFHIKLFNNNILINDSIKLQMIVDNHKSHFLNLIKKILII